ncbi:hypothetical protein CAC42_2470 [Sphaceloma murrayae]|uniref:Uncharacterized protein n=1 Tax=Sphaceloma murrayae TaxID=2082308 RepID=A0A2K1QWM1_9PEZI|nr:hypothetical protein CAC42_2470 [Sphaceloma murrayae]
MTDVQSRVAAFAPQNEQLLAVLRQTDYAEGALKQQQIYSRDVERELAQVTKDVEQLKKKTLLEQAQFERYRDSNIKRFAYKLGGSKSKEKFTSKTEKEEKEYFEALENERGAIDRKGQLASALSEAQSQLTNYQNAQNTHLQAQKDLDDLYNMLFAGPTPDFPAEDQSEWVFTQARQHYTDAEQRHRAVAQAADILAEAHRLINLAAGHMVEARSASRMDMFGGGSMADMAERSALSKAEGAAGQVRMLVGQAKRVYAGGVEDVGPMDVAQGNVMSDMLFDNIFTDMNFHEKIKASQAQIEAARVSIRGQAEGLRRREGEMRGVLEGEQVRLDEARRRLQEVRAGIFAQAGGAPPAYGS